MSLSRQPVTDVQATVVRLHDEAHLSLDQIAQQLDVTKERVRQIYVAAHAALQDFADHGPKAICLLPGRARSVLNHCNYHSWAEVRAAMENGELQILQGGIMVYWRKSSLRSVGRKTWFALYEWAGRPVMPHCNWHSIYYPSDPK